MKEIFILNIMDKLDKEIDILIELQRLQSLYNHYTKLYRKVILLCCSNQKSVAKFNRDYYKDKLKEKKDELKAIRALTS